MDHVLRLFLEEGADQVERLDELLLDLEERPGDAALEEELLRVAHTFKGASATASLPACSAVAHRMEDLMDGARSRGEAVEGQTLDELARLVGRLRDALDAVGRGEPEPPPPAGADAPAGAERASATGIVLGEYDHVRLAVLRRRGCHVLQVDVPLAEPGRAARAREVVAALRASCDVVATAPDEVDLEAVGSSRVDLQACKLEYSIVSPK